MALNLMVAVVLFTCFIGLPHTFQTQSGYDQFVTKDSPVPIHDHKLNFTTSFLYRVLIYDDLKMIFSPALMVLNSVVTSMHCPQPKSTFSTKQDAKVKKSFSRSLILLLLLVSGNINVNPGPQSSENLIHLSTSAAMANRNGIGFLHMNARSILPKLDQLKTWCMMAKPDIVVISESWLRSTVTDDVLHVDGYNVFRCDRKARGGGVAIYVSTKFNASILCCQSIPKQFEFLALQIKIANAPLTIIGCYRPPSAMSEALANLTEVLSSYNGTEMVLLGDLNLDWLSDKSEALKSTCNSLNLVQLIDSPTRFNSSKSKGDTLLDVVLTNAAHKYTAIGVFANMSDHCVIGCVRDTKIPKSKGLVIFRRCFKHFSEQAFLHDLADIEWDRLALIPTIDDAVALFQSQFLTIANKHAPLKKFRVKNRDNPWFSNELAQLLHSRDEQWSLARKSTSIAAWQRFRALRNKCTSAIRTAKSDYYLTLTDDCSANHSKLWKTIKVLQNKKCSVLPQHLNVGNVPIVDKREMLNAFNIHFEKAGHMFDHSSPPPSKVSPESPMPAAEECPSSVTPLDFGLFQVSDVLQALSAIDPKKAAGPDGLDPFLLKTAAAVIAKPVTLLFNMSISLNQVPTIWKQAFITPLFKAGDRSDVNNYRPISNLSALSKILESLVATQIKSHLESNGILDEMQSGFRSRHSTVTATLKVTDDIKMALDKKLVCAAMFIDLTKAFDTVDHPLLINALQKAALGTNSVNWSHSYLSDRTQMVKHGNELSDPVTVLKGVPQGSVLGPLLFLLFINKICDRLKFCKFHLYADDTVIYSSAASTEQALANLQADFSLLQYAFSDLKLLLNSSKTKLMFFSSERSPAACPPITSLDGTSIELVHHYKYLGFWLDSNLNFKHHIDLLAKKLKFTLGFLYRMKACFSLDSRKRLVVALFLSQLDYGDTIYRFASPTTLSKLDPLYHSALRFITNKSFRTHHCTLYSLVGWPSLFTRRLFHWYFLIYKIILGKLPLYLSVKFSAQTNAYNLRSLRWLHFNVPTVKKKMFGEASLAYYGPWSWNDLQNSLKLENLNTSLHVFKQRVKAMYPIVCNCF